MKLRRRQHQLIETAAALQDAERRHGRRFGRTVIEKQRRTRLVESSIQ